MTIKHLFKTAPVTTLLLISFIGLYIMQVLSGADANNPTTEQLLHWGANALPYTMSDEPWRLVSSAFLHIGLMHLLFNSFAMYFFGQIAEPMFGSSKFLALFLLAAIGGNLLNSHITWQSILDGTGQPGLSAGASGGIMGIGAALLIAAFFKISVNGMVLNLKSLIFIMGINLVYGFAVPGIDNAGHIGGAITGAVIAFSFGIAHRKRQTAIQASIATYQTDYVNNMASDNIYAETDGDIRVNSYNTTNIDSPFNNDMNTGTDFSTNADIYSDHITYTNVKKNANNAIPMTAQPTIIWQILPWIAILLVAVGFVWWWQDIHNQLLQVLAAIE